MREIILIQVSGSDRPGLTAAFTRILARYRLNILGIGQAVIHDTLSLGIGNPAGRGILRSALCCSRPTS